jgi:hypothetical protein
MMIMISKMIIIDSHTWLSSLSYACRYREGCAPLHLAAKGGHSEVAKVLVECKADVSAVNVGE